MISTLPPVTCISDYTLGLVKALSKYYKIDFIGFKSPYPKLIFPGKIYDSSSKQPIINNVNIRNILTWYNPFSWIYASLSSKGEIIHAQWWSWPLAPIYFTTLIIAKYIRKKKIIITIHNVQPHEKGFIKRMINRLIFFLGDTLVVHTQSGKEELEKTFKKPIYVLPHGIIEISKKGYSKYMSRKYLGIQKDRKVILFFGGIRDYKGLDTLLYAFSRVINKENKAFLIIAGNLWEDFSKYEKIISDCNLSKFILKHTKFIPNSELEYYFSASDLVVLPYKKFDAQSGVGALTLNFNKPIIVSNLEGLKGLVNNNLEYIFKRENYTDLSKKILFFLNKDNYSGNSINNPKLFSWNEITKELSRIYEGIK